MNRNCEYHDLAAVNAFNRQVANSLPAPLSGRTEAHILERYQR